MTTITLPADLEARLAEEAHRRGTTVEALAVAGLRTIYPVPAEITELPPGATMYDFLKDYIGVLEGTSDLSRDTGKQYCNLLYEEYIQKQADRESP